MSRTQAQRPHGKFQLAAKPMDSNATPKEMESLSGILDYIKNHLAGGNVRKYNEIMMFMQWPIKFTERKNTKILALYSDECSRMYINFINKYMIGEHNTSQINEIDSFINDPSLQAELMTIVNFDYGGEDKQRIIDTFKTRLTYLTQLHEGKTVRNSNVYILLTQDVDLLRLMEKDSRFIVCITERLGR